MKIKKEKEKKKEKEITKEKEKEKEGRKEGRKERNIEIAKSMKNKKMDINLISELTGLTEEEINEL